MRKKWKIYLTEILVYNRIRVKSCNELGAKSFQAVLNWYFHCPKGIESFLHAVAKLKRGVQRQSFFWGGEIAFFHIFERNMCVF